LLHNSTTSSKTIQLTANDTGVIDISGTLVTTGSNGTLQFLWAQATSNAAPTTVIEGSYLKAEELQ
jgi:hypothetical protein